MYYQLHPHFFYSINFIHFIIINSLILMFTFSNPIAVNLKQNLLWLSHLLSTYSTQLVYQIIYLAYLANLILGISFLQLP